MQSRKCYRQVEQSQSQETGSNQTQINPDKQKPKIGKEQGITLVKQINSLKGQTEGSNKVLKRTPEDQSQAYSRSLGQVQNKSNQLRGQIRGAECTQTSGDLKITTQQNLKFQSGISAAA